MKVWARYAVPVMVLVDEDSDEIERVVLVAGERDIDRAHPSMEMLFYTEELELISDSRDEAAHALSVGDHCRWPDVSDWEIEQSWDGLRMLVDELRHPSCPDCDGDGYTWPADDPDAEGVACPRCAGNGTGSSSGISAVTGRRRNAPSGVPRRTDRALAQRPSPSAPSAPGLTSENTRGSPPPTSTATR